MPRSGDARCGLVALLLLWLALCAPAWAHHASAGVGDSGGGGLPIPNLSHGEMAVIAANRTAILDLAAKQVPTDPVFRRLLNFAALQRTYCLWDLVPDSVSDEASPFNECSHAYLAAVRALLLHMQDMAKPQDGVHALVGKIEGEMLSSDASLLLCRYSGEPFNTAAIVRPRWGDVPFHTPSLLLFGGMALTFAGGVSLIGRLSGGGKDVRRAAVPPGPGSGHGAGPLL